MSELKTTSEGETLENESYFARRLKSDPALAARCGAMVGKLRNAANDELRAVESSELLTEEDFEKVINARAEDMFDE